MGGLAPINNAAIELAQIFRKLERRLKTLFIQFQTTRVCRKIGRGQTSNSRIAPRSPKQLLTAFSNKAAPFLHKKKIAEEDEEKIPDSDDGGLWQKEILMGEKCQPLDFSGAIYYDHHGNPLAGIPPRSPRVRNPMVQSGY